ncbi:MAG TPA: tetratricopeptide repeat protein [Verrucomicrobiae bacterium]|jgi:serine/threonine protein kinase/TPR repeat protein/primosomal replication protein N|nr:tetratricopeptide repeat protein [Verrucomicrobiae bacterium]
MPDSIDRELAIFSDARLLPATQRAAFLDAACPDDPDLRRRIEELLAVAGETSTFMETPAGDLLNPGEFSRATATEKPGERIGRYELLETIGEGGCGVVYKASQEEPVRRLVALKIIKLGMDTRSVIARFEAERQALALMDHPNIAKVLDAGATNTGRPYFVMEIVDGVKITDFCDQHNLSTSDRLKLFIQVCHAVQHAHQKGIIHRDIKPSNILVTMTDGVPVPKVIDFGIAKATHGKLTDKTFVTALGHFIGTPAYMSPEQADARESDVDTRSDIYSLGVLLYELLTGHTLFDAKELARSGVDGIRRSIREQDPPPPSTRLSTMEETALRDIARHRKSDSSQLIHTVRGDLDWIAMKALDKERTRRYETTNALALDIRRYLANEPITARPPSRVYQFQKLVRRHRLGFVAAAVIGLALTVGVAVSIRASIKEHQARLEADVQRLQALANEQNAERAEAIAERAQATAEAEEKKARVEATKNQQIARFLEDMLNGVSPSVAMGADTTLLKKILDNTSKRIGTDLTNAPDVEANLRDTLGQVYWAIGDLTNAESMHRAALALRTQALGQNAPGTAESMEHLSHVLWREGKLNEAGGLALAAVQIQTVCYGATNLQVARSLDSLAAILNTRGFGARAATALRQSLAIKEALLGSNNLEVADTMDDLGGLLLSMHSSEVPAEDMCRQAQAVREKTLGTNNPIVAIDSLKVEKIQDDIEGRSADEEAVLYKLVAVQTQLYGGPHPDIAQSLNSLAFLLKNEGKLAESEAVRRKALAMQQTLLGKDSPELAQTLSNLGQVLIAENKLADAEPFLQTSYAMRRKMFGDGSDITSTMMTDLGQLLEKEGKFEEATNLFLTHAGGASACAASADYFLGLMYLHGWGFQTNPVEAAAWILKSAQLGHQEAQVDLGSLYLNGIGVPKDENHALAWLHKADASRGLVTARLSTTRALANCYCAAGHSKEALATLDRLSQIYPRDMDTSLTLAAWQMWFGQTNDYQATRWRIMQFTKNNDDAAIAVNASKACCLAPCLNAVLQSNVLNLAKLGVDRCKDTSSLASSQLSLGMAQYRIGRYADADQTLALASQTPGSVPDISCTAQFFRAMCLFQEANPADARELFNQAQSQMTPLPRDPNVPVIDARTASHDTIVSWLAFHEAQSLLNQAGGTAGN